MSVSREDALAAYNVIAQHDGDTSQVAEAQEVHWREDRIVRDYLAQPATRWFLVVSNDEPYGFDVYSTTESTLTEDLGRVYFMDGAEADDEKRQMAMVAEALLEAGHHDEEDGYVTLIRGDADLGAYLAGRIKEAREDEPPEQGE